MLFFCKQKTAYDIEYGLVGSEMCIRDRLEILVCPVTKGPLVYDKEKQELLSKSARLAYPIKDGIPVMLEDEARRLEPHEIE